MKEKPVIFGTDMVRAILDGRKSQTRRVLKPQPRVLHRTGDGFSYYWTACDYIIEKSLVELMDVEAAHVVWCDDTAPQEYFVRRCPYGHVGDRLWVRERHAFIAPHIYSAPIEQCDIEYYADNPVPYPGDWPAEAARGNPDAPKWRSSIFMPRWASRITLEITGAHIERLQQIGGSDAWAEGGMTVAQFIDLWNRINARRGYVWDTNPWVYVIEFERIQNDK